MTTRKISSALIALPLLLMSAMASADGVIANGSFEQPALSAGSFQYSPAGSSWTFGSNGSGGAGISTANSGFTSGAPEVPLGKQVAFLQNQGFVSQQVPYSNNAILTFNATQRVNYGSQQSIQVLVNGVAQSITLGNRTGATSVTSITPPADRYNTYAVKLNMPCGPTGCPSTVTVAIAGTVASGDATAFIDTADITTPSNHAYGLWDPSASLATWRSDYATNTNSPTYGVCLFASATDQTQRACKSPNISYPSSNWYSSSGYAAGGYFWQLAWNDEPYNSATNPSCASGPPDQSLPMVSTFRAAGAYLGIQAITDPFGSNYNNIGFSYGTRGSVANGCIPYQSFGANARHGNGKPIALMDKAGTYRPKLSFYANPAANNNAAAIGCARLVLTLGGFQDNIDRFLFVDLDCLNIPPEPATFYPGISWNWPIKDSSYYPGALSLFIGTTVANSRCGLSLPTMSLTNPGSGGFYSFDIYKLVSCAAAQAPVDYNDGRGPIYPWFGSAQLTQLPDPVIVTRVEWALESQDDSTNANLGVSYSRPNVQ
ncbi:hypothetical protein [Dyella koreensis]|uniref:MSHA biogenesis protein MshQ n=1 Tax=Dyella koreensis TaxID=311235 RepID=A0ABW8KAY3_9GAMM